MSKNKAVGFTGSRKGMTRLQHGALHAYLLKCKKKGLTEFHYGDCIGSDEEAAWTASLMGFKLHSHPCTLENQRAHTELKLDVAKIYPQLDPLKRNHVIVDSVIEMYATPSEAQEVLRSGTWATIRYAQKKDIPVTIIEPLVTR